MDLLRLLILKITDRPSNSRNYQESNSQKSNYLKILSINIRKSNDTYTSILNNIKLTSFLFLLLSKP